MVTIHEGGFDPDERSDRVLWEVDLIVGPHNQSAIGTLEERNPHICDLSTSKPSQRRPGKNENANGLLSQYFPKSGNLNNHTPDNVARVEAKLNGRPRRSPRYRTPTGLFTRVLEPHQQT